jgi:hypothetical protein
MPNRFRDQTVIPSLSHATLEILLKYKQSEDYHDVTGKPLTRYYNSILNLMCRHLEYFVVPRVSVAAQQRAQELQVGGRLADMRWVDQRGRMKDPNRTIFQFEHIKPVGDMRSELLSLESPTVEQVEKIISQADVAWILREENDRLPRDNRGADPMQCYRDCNIEFVPEEAEVPEAFPISPFHSPFHNVFVDLSFILLRSERKGLQFLGYGHLAEYRADFEEAGGLLFGRLTQDGWYRVAEDALLPKSEPVIGDCIVFGTNLPDAGTAFVWLYQTAETAPGWIALHWYP